MTDTSNGLDENDKVVTCMNVSNKEEKVLVKFIIVTNVILVFSVSQFAVVLWVLTYICYWFDGYILLIMGKYLLHVG